ncbi:MAG: rane-bound lytic murein transglycosylase B-like protein [Deltaproteobacteria bacterium]|nr:rane-bound lytic murein transglycosylase B-like protein [Deltaproteobacteria bacterium]
MVSWRWPWNIQPENWSRRFFLAVPLSFILLCLPANSWADWSPLISRLAADGFNEQALQELFSRPQMQFEPGAMGGKLESLLRSRAALGEAPGPSSQKNGVMKSLLKNPLLAKARSFLNENRSILENIHSLYGVPKEIVVSILLIESRLGEYLGEKIAFNRLASMALCTDLEKIRPYVSRKLLTARTEEYARERCQAKAEWAYQELRALLEYSEKSGLDPLGIPGSTYGAIGLCQFMPSNISLFGVDADLDGRIDLFSKDDALHSIANYLRGHGWSTELPRRAQQKVIYAYNHCPVYVNTVLAIADRLKEKSRPKQKLG